MPIKISQVLTDCRPQFTDQFSTTEKKPNGQHAFEKVCAGMGIEHRLAPPRHPQTNGTSEWFNGRISELLQQTRLAGPIWRQPCSIPEDLQHHISQRAIDAKTPVRALNLWMEIKRELFVKFVYDQTGLDT